MSSNAWGSDDPAQVAKGGTGAATLTDGGVLLGSGTGAVTVTAQPTNGQLLIGSTSADPVLAVPSGTANEVGVATGAGTLTLGIADDAVLPGSASVTIPAGNTAAEPSATNGMLRYDSDTDKIRGVVASSWVDLDTGGGGGGGAWTLLDVSTPSTATEVVFDNTLITSTHSSYAFMFVLTVSGSDILAGQLSDDNGVSYYSTGEYQGAKDNFRLTGNGALAGPFWGFFYLQNVGAAFDMSYSNTKGGQISSSDTGTGGDFDPGGTVTINAARLFCQAGETLTGTIRLFGLQTAI